MFEYGLCWGDKDDNIRSAPQRKVFAERLVEPLPAASEAAASSSLVAFKAQAILAQEI